MGKEEREREGGREGKISPPLFVDGSQNFKMEPIKKDTEGSPSELLFFTQCHIISYFFSLSLFHRKVRLKKLLFRDKKHKGEGRVKTTPPGSDDEASPEHDHRTLKVQHVPYMYSIRTRYM